MTSRILKARDWVWVCALVVIPMLSLFIWWLSAVIWLPDLVSPDSEHVIARCAIDSGESFELTQRWVGDGYLTGVRHRSRGGTSVFAVGDGDAARAFRCRVLVSTNDSCVTFHFSGKQWRYYWRLHSLAVGDGQSREAT
jgi:hypothetical protein